MLAPKYAAGDRVVAVADKSNENVRSGVYTIVKVLPLVGRVRQYRVKNALDTHDRVLDEEALLPADG